MDIISFNEASTANGRIENFNANPDSTSGIVTQPSIIQSGEIVSIPAGRTAIMANTVIDGTINLDGTMFIPSGSSVDFTNGITVNGNSISLSIPTSYHLLQGNLSVSNEVITNGFSTKLYTGNGITQSVITGIDMTTQWGNDVSETFGGLVWLKDRVTAGAGHVLSNTIRGINKYLQTNNNGAETTLVGTVTSFNNNGFSIGNQYNINLASIVSWNFQTTYRITGVTNHGKAYTEHYNPFTGFTIIEYEGSGLYGHEIPHSLGRKLGFRVHKSLTAASSWIVLGSVLGSTNYLALNDTSAIFGSYSNIDTNSSAILSVGSDNTSGTTQIMYGWADSYFDESKKLIGNYEVGVYQGTGGTGNKVTTRGKPAWIMIKRLDAIGNWNIFDNIRNSFDGCVKANTTEVELIADVLDSVSDGFILKTTDAYTNASGGQYLYMVVYDNDSGSGKSKYPKTTDTSNVQINNAIIPLAHGVDSNGSKNSIVIANETITGLTYTIGKNYLYKTNTGYGVKSIQPSYGKINPLIGDFYNVITNKWYSNTNVEITESRNYLNHIVHADQNGQVTYVEELPKIEYKDIVKANEYKGKNACTAWAIYDSTTTPPTIIDSYNISSIIRISSGVYDLYFAEEMDTKSYSISGLKKDMASLLDGHLTVIYQENTTKKLKIQSIENGTSFDSSYVSIQVFGGKNS